VERLQFLGAFNDNAFKNARVNRVTYTVASWGESPVLVTVAAGIGDASAHAPSASGPR